WSTTTAHGPRTSCAHTGRLGPAPWKGEEGGTSAVRSLRTMLRALGRMLAGGGERGATSGSVFIGRSSCNRDPETERQDTDLRRPNGPGAGAAIRAVEELVQGDLIHCAVENCFDLVQQAVARNEATRATRERLRREEGLREVRLQSPGASDAV